MTNPDAHQNAEIAERTERRWVTVMVIVMIVLPLMAAYAGIHQATMPQPRVETTDPTRLHLSGEFDFLLQVTLRDSQEYEDFLDQKLCALPMVDKVHSSLVLKEYKMEAALPLGSTDMGNVTQLLPGIHPMVAVDAGGASLHQPDFTAAAAGPSADKAVIDGAIMLARTVVRLAESPGERDRVLEAQAQRAAL